MLGDRSLLVVDFKVNPFSSFVVIGSGVDKWELGHGNDFNFGQSVDERRVFEALDDIEHVGFIDEGSKIDNQVLLRFDDEKRLVNSGIMN